MAEPLDESIPEDLNVRRAARLTAWLGIVYSILVVASFALLNRTPGPTSSDEDYLSFYAAEFVPADGASRKKWENERRQRVSEPSIITIDLESLSVQLRGADRARVEFTQTYVSDTYSDTVNKVLDFVWQDSTWKIVAERVVD